MAAKKPIPVGTKFGRLTVIGVGEPTKDGSTSMVRCDCSIYKTVLNAKLRSGAAKSCGCLKRSRLGAHSKTHGKCNTPEYRNWAAMKARCFDENNIKYREYGTRGISMCVRWVDSFEEFYKDIGQRPSPQHSIDRIDNNRNYGPENCRWATKSEQANNRRSNHRMTFYGKTMTMTEWSILSLVLTSTIRRRLKLGWTEAEAVFRQTGTSTCPAR